MRILRNLRLDNILCAEEGSSYGEKQKIMPFFMILNRGGKR